MKEPFMVLKLYSQENPQRFPMNQKGSKNEMHNQKWIQKCDLGPILIQQRTFFGSLVF